MAVLIIEQLTLLRAQKRLAATVLSTRSGIDTSNIYAIERGRRDPRASTIESYAQSLGAKIILVDTQYRSSAAETAEALRESLDSGNTSAAAQALVQLVSNIRALPTLGKLALTADAPLPIEPRWDASIAGIVETELLREGLPVPLWTAQVAGDPTWAWDPWTGGQLSIADDDVAEPLRRRGIFASESELASA